MSHTLEMMALPVVPKMGDGPFFVRGEGALFCAGGGVPELHAPVFGGGGQHGLRGVKVHAVDPNRERDADPLGEGLCVVEAHAQPGGHGQGVAIGRVGDVEDDVGGGILQPRRA